MQLRDLLLDSQRPYIRLRAENTKARREREAALNELGLWAANQLLTRARMLGAHRPDHHLLAADLSKHTKRTDPLHGGDGFDPNRHQIFDLHRSANLRAPSAFIQIFKSVSDRQ